MSRAQVLPYRVTRHASLLSQQVLRGLTGSSEACVSGRVKCLAGPASAAADGVGSMCAPAVAACHSTKAAELLGPRVLPVAWTLPPPDEWRAHAQAAGRLG